MTTKFHLSPTGLKPCEATVRACKYGHVNSDGSFTKGTSIKEMAQLVEGLKQEIVKNPEDNSQYDLYYSARRNYEQNMSNSTEVNVETLLQVSYGSVITRNVDLTDENYDEIRSILLSKFGGVKNRYERSTVVQEFFNLTDKAYNSSNANERVLNEKLVTELVASTVDHETLAALHESDRNHRGRQEWVSELILNNPNCSDYTANNILASNLSYNFKQKHADSVPGGWVTVTNTTDWVKEGTSRKNEAVQSAVKQVARMKNSSIPVVDVAQFIETTGGNPPIPVNKLLGKMSSRFEKTYLYSVNASVSAGTSIITFAAKDPGSLSKTNLLKIIDLARNEGGKQYSSRGLPVSYTYITNKIISKALTEGKILRPGSKPLSDRTYTSAQRDKLLDTYDKASRAFEESGESYNHIGGKRDVMLKAELAYDVAHYENFDIELKMLDKQRRKPFTPKHKIENINRRERVITERMVKARIVREWDALQDYIKNAVPAK